MPANDYAFLTHWRVQATAAEVYDVLANGADLVRWWPSVYLAAEEVQPGDKDGVGRVIALTTKGWLPYILRWQFRVTEARRPTGFALEAQGDFVGQGVWTFRQDGAWVDITYDWRIRADKGILRYLSFMMKPLFAANHRWAMARGEESLKLELQRRRARTPEERALVPAPPGPTFGAGGKKAKLARSRKPTSG